MPDYLDLFRPLLEHGTDLYFVYDLASRRVVYASAAYEHIIGDPSAHIHDDLPFLLARIDPDDWQYLCQRVAQAAPDELVQRVALRLRRADGGTQWLSTTVFRRAPVPEGQYLVGTAQDITSDKESSINAQKFNTKKDATLEILSHDMAAPLALLQQLTEQLTWEMDDAPDKVHELLRIMQRTCVQGVNLIRDFVDGEFLESVNVELGLERADLTAWLRLILAEYQHSEQHMHLQFSFESAEQPIYANFDVNKLQQVVNNLLSNAIKFTPDGGRIAVSIERRAGQARLTVADTGVGIPAALQPILFEKFTKARRPGLRGERTTGLGMSVIKTIMDLHQGRIWLESAEGQGTTFYLELPALPE